MYFTYWKTPIGKLRLRATDEALVGVDHVNQQESVGSAWEEFDDHPILKLAVLELDEYFAGTRKEFTIPLAPHGTPFQEAVWAALQEIPFGQTASYADIAERVGSPQAVRAVGSANGRNPLSIFIPCHRVIAKNGTLAGYAGGVEIKKRLLTLEQTIL